MGISVMPDGLPPPLRGPPLSVPLAPEAPLAPLLPLPLLGVEPEDDSPVGCPEGLPVLPSSLAFCSTSAARAGSVLSRTPPLDGELCACAHPAASINAMNNGVAIRFI
jgi:hypothetical protein